MKLCIQAWKCGIERWRLILQVYLIQLILILFLGFQFYDLINTNLSHSLEVEKLVTQFDYTVFSDFLKSSGKQLANILTQLKYLIPVWLLIAIFLDSCQLLSVMSNKNTSTILLFQKMINHFASIFKIVFVILVISIIWSLLVFLPLVLNLEKMLESFSSEKYALLIILVLFILWIFGIVVLFVWSVLTRLELLANGSSIFNSLRIAWSKFLVIRGNALFFMLLYLLIHVFVFLLYLFIEGKSGMTSNLLICIFIILQQSIIIFRIQLRLMVYSGLLEMSRMNNKNYSTVN